MTTHFDSDPLVSDTDGDGLSDAEERFATKTDPRRDVTYRTTQIRQREVVDRFADLYREFERSDGPSARTVLQAAIAYGLLDAEATGEELLSLNLTDATDDFDLVRADDGSLDFLALDDRRRTDTWLSNVEELRGEHRTDIFDPDTDDDGLTDGQEVKGVTETVTVALSDREFNTVTLPMKDETITTRTDPTDPDTDGDGVWDGWLGVHGVGHSENVVLYMEHLESGDGLVGDELVVEQAGIHEVTGEAPARTSAVVDGERVHSNIHVGELHWGTDSLDDGEWPDRSLTVEVDYYPTGGTLALDNREWERGIERNFALYGFRVDVVRDEKLPRQRNYEDGIDLEELVVIDDNHRSTGADEYLLVVHEYTGPDSDAAIAATVPGTTRQFITMDELRGEAGDISNRQVRKTPYSNATITFGVVLELQEGGYVFSLGDQDDAGPDAADEVYSGSDEDLTVETLPGGVQRWSIMTRPWTDQLLVVPMDGRYFAFSVEELATANSIEP